MDAYKNEDFPIDDYVKHVAGGVIDGDVQKRLYPDDKYHFNKAKSEGAEHKQRGLMFQIVDVNFDGEVDFYEFLKFIFDYKLFHHLGGGSQNLFPQFLNLENMKEKFNSIGNWAAYSIPIDVGLKEKLQKLSHLCKARDIDLKHFMTMANCEAAQSR